MNLAETLLHALRNAGVKEIFGIPGDFVLSLFKVIEESGIVPFYTLSHEPGVGFAADGAARWRCGPSAAVVTYGAGALNMVNAVAAAYAEKSPLVVISGGPGISEDHTELLLHHQAKRLDSQFQIYREVTCAQTRLADLHQAPCELQRVLAECLRQSRPVYIEVPRDLVFRTCERTALPDRLSQSEAAGDVTGKQLAALQESAAGSRCDPDAVFACADEIEARLRTARAPVMMVGVEVRRFGLERQVAELALQWGVPVVTSFMGRGLLVGPNAPLVGTYLGIAGDPHITDLVERSDALVLLGVILSDTNLGTSKKNIDLRHAVQVRDGQVSLGFHTYPEIPLATLVDELRRRPPLGLQHSASPLAQRPVAQAFVADDASMTPDDVAAGVNKFWNQGDPLLVAADVGDCLFTAMGIERAQLAAPGYYASMGFAVPAGLGMQAASGHRTLILVGDGAFQMTGWELGNCRRYGWDPIVIVMNNACWEMLRTFQPESQFNLLDEWQFADLAAGLGGRGVRVRTRGEFATALQRACQRRGRFELIEVMLQRGVVTQAMTRFTRGLKALRAGRE